MIPALLLILAAVIYRVVMGLLIQSGQTGLSNFVPFAAIALCSAAYLPGKLKFTLPLLGLFLSDLILNSFYGQPFFSPLIICRYLVLAAICAFGWILENRASFRTMLPASLASSTFFYLSTNTFSWLTDAGYVKTAAGWVQALTVGLPAYGATPTWMFFRNAVVSDLVFTALFVSCIYSLRRRERLRAGAALPHTA